MPTCSTTILKKTNISLKSQLCLKKYINKETKKSSKQLKIEKVTPNKREKIKE